MYSRQVINRVELSKSAKKQLQKVPQHVVTKLLAWVDDVEQRGLEEVRKTPGFHDEPLKGKRKGQRSIRLSKSYRAIYELLKDGSIEFVEVQEVNKHEY